jgi:hypothetical protein
LTSIARTIIFGPMTATELRKFWHRAPFVPFDLVVPGRDRLHVPHPHFLSVSPTEQVAHIWKPNGDYAVVDVLLITAIEENRRRARRRA